MYKFAALAATGGVTAAAIVAVHYRFTWQLASSGAHFSSLEAALTLLLTLGGVVRPCLCLPGSLVSCSSSLLDSICLRLLWSEQPCSGCMAAGKAQDLWCYQHRGHIAREPTW